MTTPNIPLTEVPSGSLQPSAPVNASLQVIDALMLPNPIVQEIRSTTPTTTDADEGLRWIVGPGATGTFAGHEDEIAYCTAANLFFFYAPQENWQARNLDDGSQLEYTGSGGWQALPGGLGDAPSDGTIYGRQNATWVAAGGGGGGVTSLAAGHGIDIDATTPAVPIVIVDETELDSSLVPFAHSGFAAGNVEDAIVEASSMGGVPPGYLGQTSITTLGTVSTGVWNATPIGPTKGGTGLTSYTTGDLIYASAANTLSALGAGTATHILTSNGPGVAPSWQAAAAGFTNPMTTAEDLIVGGASGTPTRQGFAANTFPARASTGGLVAKTISDFSLTVLDDANQAAWQATLALVPGTNVQAYDADLATIAGLTATTDNFMQAKAGAWASRTVAQVSVDLQGTGLITDAVGFRTVPQNSQSTAYTFVAADSGKHILHPSADTTARIFTIPANSAVAYPIGTAITIVNQNAAGVITIAITTDTMRLAGAGTTGSRTLAANGIATALKITSTEWIISGTGLT